MSQCTVYVHCHTLVQCTWFKFSLATVYMYMYCTSTSKITCVGLFSGKVKFGLYIVYNFR